MSYELTPTPAMRKARKLIPWVPDEELPEIKFRSPAGAATTSVLLPGAAELMNRRTARGAVTLAGSLAVIGLGFWIGMGGWVFAITAAAGAYLAPKAFADAKALNVFSAARESHRLTQTQSAGATALRLLRATPLAAEAAATATVQQPAVAASSQEDDEHDEHARGIIQKLRQGYKLYRSGMLSGDEFQDRKVEVFSSTGIVDREGMDSLMEALVPLFEEGIVDDEDLALLKAIADVPLGLTEF